MKRVLSLVLAAAGLLMCVCGGCAAKLTDDEQRVADIVAKLVNMMKDPDSFKLRDDIVVIYTDDPILGKTYYTYITYSANNSFGASLVDTAMFADNRYIGSVDDDADDLETADEKTTLALAQYNIAAWNFTLSMGGDPTKNTDWISAETVSMEKIANHLKVDYVG